MANQQRQLDPFTNLILLTGAFLDGKRLHKDLAKLVREEQGKNGVLWFGARPAAEAGPFELPWPPLIENIRSRVQLLSNHSFNACQLHTKPRADQLEPHENEEFSQRVVMLPLNSDGVLTVQPSDKLRAEADFYLQAHGGPVPIDLQFKANNLLIFDGPVDKWWDYKNLKFKKKDATLLIFRSFLASGTADITQLLPNYKKLLSPDTGNGVFLLTQVLAHPTQPNALAPLGFDFDKYPTTGAAFDPQASTFTITVWDGGEAAILYVETSEAVEETLLKEAPVASRYLPDFMRLLVLASTSHTDAKVKKLSQSLLEDMAIGNLLRKELTAIKDPAKYEPKLERRLATALLNPKRTRF